VELLQAMSGIFIENAGNSLRELRTAIEHEDRKNIGRLAHSFKGAAGSIGGVKSMKLALNMEKSAATAPISALLESEKELEQSVEELISALQTYVTTLQSEA
jgi:HPt (histidine-containing phosphotransfer) domain-containing protein